MRKRCVRCGASQALQQAGQAQQRRKFIERVGGEISAQMVAVAKQELVADGRDAIGIPHLIRWEEREHVSMAGRNRAEDLVGCALSLRKAALRNRAGHRPTSPALLWIAPEVDALLIDALQHD